MRWKRLHKRCGGFSELLVPLFLTSLRLSHP